MRFGVLGPLAVWSEDGTLVTIRGLKVRALLADLLVHQGRPVSADRLLDELWSPAELPRNPAAALQSKVSQLRRALESAEPGARELVESSAAGYSIRVDAEAVDAGRFMTLVSRASDRSDPHGRAALLTEALALWRGTAFGEFADEEFARGAISRLDEQRLVAVEQLAEARLELGEHTLLVGELGDLVTQHPLRERLRTAHLRALYGAGRQTEALEDFEAFRERLRDELGVDPSPELTALHQAILRQDGDLAPAYSAAGTVARRTTNLPGPIEARGHGGLVGRDLAIADVRARLGTSRLITLTGPGGVGKTRLAVEGARAAADDFVDGAWIVELGACDQRTDPANAVVAISTMIATVLEVREDSVPGVPDAGSAIAVPDRIAAALRAKELVLVLDSCEHVAEPVAHVAERLLSAAPGIRLLVTSREPLRLANEVVLPVAPLELPEQVDTTPAQLQRSTAVQLFAARAAAASPSFVLSEQNAAAVAEICRRLDGIPLALELAAARVRSLAVHELATRLDDRFAVLGTGHRTAPQRQRTLRAVIDWSWQLLSPEEATVLRRLAVYADGCTLTAAEAVCAGGMVPAAEVVELLSSLVDRSLVTVVDDEAHHRYRLFESVAAYCRERLEEAGESAMVGRRHAEYYAQLAERNAAKLRGHGQDEALRILDNESGNLRVALANAVRDKDTSLALRLVNAVAWYWFLRGRHHEARRWLTQALQLATPADEAAQRARATALTWRAAVAFTDYADDPVGQRKAVLQRYDEIDDPAGRAHAQWLIAYAMTVGSGDLAVGVELVSDALAAFRELGDRWGVAAALLTRAEQALACGDLTAVRRDSEESLALFDQLGDRWGQFHPMRLLGALAEIGGDYDEAGKLHREGLRIAEDLALWPCVCVQLARLGRVSLLTGRMAEAEEYHQRALRVAEDQSYGGGVSFAATGLALGARRQGQLDVAEAHLRQPLEWNRRVGFLPGVALVQAELGFIAELRGDAEAARRLHLDGLAAARETADPRAIALAFEGFAGVSALREQHARAASLLGAAAAARESCGVPLPPAERGDVDRISGVVRAALGSDAFAVAFEQGAARGVDDSLGSV